jgi:phosphopantothenoylcysteine decarboxylase/phosphopantothenate--cysteine ligase
LPDPAGVQVVPVVSAADLRTAVLAAAADADVVVMTAAVADFRPAGRSDSKIKKTADGGVPELQLVRTADVLAELATDRPRAGQVVVGFAAETDHVLENGRAKLARKRCDLLVVNAVGEGAGFEVDHNAAVILGADGSETSVPMGSKDALADAVWDAVLARLDRP